MKTLYFLGPKGTYSEIASKKIAKLLDFDVEFKEISTIAKVASLVNNNPDVIGVLPIENSIEGIVRQTVDSLYALDIKIQAQIDIKIEHCLISKSNNKASIKHLVSHPQALAQSSNFILKNFDENIELINANSTADAVTSILEKDNTWAAIAGETAANQFNLNILDKNIGDIKENKTRFALVALDKIKFREKDSRTSIVFNTKNESGALLKILEIFKKYDLNLVYLESRPSKKVFGEYNFFSDIDKGQDEILSALKEIEQECNFYKLLGSYPVIE